MHGNSDRRRPGADRLGRYRGKRTASATPEPFGGMRGTPGLFCVQKHGATRLHWDFRLELGGTLRSWAVPRGPSLDPAEKRLAVEVEDHPVEYGDFEGIIPTGNYGAGAVVLWDRGSWTALEDPVAGLEKGKLLFELHGQKLHGVWTLVRTKSTGKPGASRDWLLIKKPDGWARRAEDDVLPQESVVSGLTLEDLEAGRDPVRELRVAIEDLGAPRRRVDAAGVGLMLAETRDAPPTTPGWLFELKHDGFRLLAAKADGRVQLRYRSGADATGAYPDVVAALAALPHPAFVADGEVVVLDEAGRSSFGRLQQRALRTVPHDVAQAAVALPATLVLFDLLAYDGFDLRALPLRTRKALLARMLPRVGTLRYCEHVEGQGAAFFEAVRAMDLEGVVAKRADAPYVAGRSDRWVKVKAPRVETFVIVGMTRPEGSRTGFGALHLATHVDGRLVYAGRVGSGFDERLLDTLTARLSAMRVPACVAEGVPPGGRGHVWVEPAMVCAVRYREWTDDGRLRQPVFVGLRDDVAPSACMRAPHTDQAPPAVPPPPATPPTRTVALTNLDKVFWPVDGYTKGDLLAYYEAVAPTLLRYLRDRPLMLTRYPDGIDGKSFFQKDAPGYAPGWLRSERMFSEDVGREVDQLVCDDVESLRYLVNMGTIPLHVWSSRVATLQSPDWCILDLDPKGAPFTDVVAVARVIRELTDALGLPSHPKTSGSTGLHVLIPLGRQTTHAEARMLAQLLATIVVERCPDIATLHRQIGGRGGRVYIDWLQNGHGKLLVAPYAVRPVPGACVSTPLRWREVTARLDHRRFTIRTVPKRIAALGDPLAGVLDEVPDLAAALTALQAQVAAAAAR